jgi:nucleotide-binding universal stress UspA family protein
MSAVADHLTSQTAAAGTRGIRSLLVHVQPEEAARGRLDAAVALARREDAFLVGVAAEEVNWAAVATDPYGVTQSVYAELCEISARNRQIAQDAFRAAAADIPHELIVADTGPIRAMCAAAVGIDLIVAGGSTGGSADPHRMCDPALLALKSGRPVLVAPPAGGALKADSVVVAWKDTREARRALGDAMPFLRGARRVTVVEAALHGERAEAQARVEKVAARLAAIGIEAAAVAREGSPDEIVPHLQAEADAREADLIVCGAYGHSRLGEWLFGGVTADLMAKPQRFLLLSH